MPLGDIVIPVEIERKGCRLRIVPEKLIPKLERLEPFSDVVREACKIKWTRDPFDRLITSQAALRKTILITKDETIRRFYPEAVW